MRTFLTVTVALADDLTGREKHEVALNRPPRVTKTYSLTLAVREVQGALRWPDLYQAIALPMNLPASPLLACKAPFYKDGAWKNDLNSPAPLGELESDDFRLYHTEEEPEASNYTGGLEQSLTI
ncbi:hypothetical protein [Escherichia coli]|uniref:hypothetical protein n=1 Tax=Escherichia coli TaxID=562 RepID=UPI0020413388|nr:hypothetical protein [Escherichia coli]